MDYTITENEYNAIDDARAQLNLVSCLLTQKSGDPAPCNASDLCAFLSAQTESLTGILKAAEQRRQGPAESMSWIHWLHAINVLTGNESQTPRGIESYISSALAGDAEVNPDMQLVASAWESALSRISKTKTAAVAKPAASRKREKLAAMK